MSRLWLLSLLCLSVLCLSLVQLTRAHGELRVNETNTRIFLEKQPAEVLLSIENSTGVTVLATVEVELLDPHSNSKAKSSQIQSIQNGNQKLSLSLPFKFASLPDKERRNFLFYRLHYRVSENGSTASPLADGVVSLSEITPDLFDLRVITSELVREGNKYLARVQASHPITRRPAANVQINGEIKISNDDDNEMVVNVRTPKTTDSAGYALLEFAIPQLFPKFPYNKELDDAEIRVFGKRGPIVAETHGDVLIDQFAKILLSSDKPLYQPGQVMHLRALVFTPSKRALAGEDTLFTISDPDGTTVFRSTAKTSRFGVASIDWSIPENTRLGDYQIWFGLEGGEDEQGAAQAMVRISRYDLPNFSVSVEPDHSYYLPGQNAEVKVRADYLFGQPVKRGRVRVVREEEREWNYREQKWDVTEGETFEGETDANGVFAARIPLAAEHENLRDEDYRPFRDVTYAAYFTDPTSNRTEQRRFDLRVTREAVHIYIIQNDEWLKSKTLPVKFYVSTYYADGTPARCKVNVSAGDQDSHHAGGAKKPLTTVRTNRYGLAKVSGVRWPSEFKEESSADLHISAVDSKGLKGNREERISFDDEPIVRVETDKALYRAGDSITAFVSSSSPDASVLVDVLRDASVVRSERVKLHNGRGSIVFPYRSEFKDTLTIAAYFDFMKWRSFIGAQSILYPHNPELKVSARTSQASYRPGEDAQVDLSVRSTDGRTSESALGVVVLDKAVEERFRTAQEFGSQSQSINNAIEQFLGRGEQIAGVSLRDLQRLDTSKPISPDLELVADVMLSQSRRFFPIFHASDEYELDQGVIYRDLLREQLKPVRAALGNRYALSAEYPKDEPGLRRLLMESNIDFNSFKDPWGNPYRAFFSFYQASDDVNFVSAGPDKRFDTGDDFSVDTMKWPYFRSIGEVIDKVIREHHARTGGFIRDANALRGELSRSGLTLDQLRDRWGNPYRFDFIVNGRNLILNVGSSGPDKQFSASRYYSQDDFLVWTSSIDYFEKTRTYIDDALKQDSENGKPFPATEQELRAALQNTRGSLDSLRDPWNNPYYVLFSTDNINMDRAKVESRSDFGEAAKLQTTIIPVTQTVRFITLRSMGPDGKPQTYDDFSMAVFMSVLSEKIRGRSEPQASTSRVAFTENTGAIFGMVTDPMGAAVAGATVSATALVDNRRRETTTRDDGTYGLINLLPGLYEVRFEAPGFSAAVYSNVMVRTSAGAEVNASLQPGAIAETVSVTAAAEPLTTQTSDSVSHSITRTGAFSVQAGNSQQLSTPRLREYFPETLLWQPSIETDKQGRAKINFKLADNITTWKMVVVGSTEDGQIGMTEKEIKAFQPFFVEHDPPRVLTEGDEISLPVTVRNYLERPQKVDLEIKPENWFSLFGPARKRVDVAAGDAARETFDLRAIASIEDGKQRLTAIGREESDAIEKPVTVHPDGEQQSVTAGEIIADNSRFDLILPQTMIPNSRRGELKIYPNLMTHVIESVEGIMERPYGCGEQTISSTYPSLLVLRHYKQNGGDGPMRGRAERYVKEGYSRLLNYRDESGGFTYWGHGAPDLALTAYALRFLNAASTVISVDANVIDQAGKWLISQQHGDGSWGSPQAATTLTAYITRVLSQVTPEGSEPIAKAREFLGAKAGELNDPYLLASVALAAMDSRDPARAKSAIDKLRTLSVEQGISFYWSPRTETPFHGWGRTGQVETTALVTQALARYCDLSPTTNCEAEKKLINGALLFLLKEKDQYGVWLSTQATINALDAMLALFARTSSVLNAAGETVVLVNGNMVQTVQIPAADRLNNPITLDISQFLNPGNNRIEVRRPRGLPFATVQAVATFYVPWSESTAATNGKNGLRLQVKFDKTESKVNDEITCNVEAARVSSSGYGMLLAEIGLPPGADVDRSSLEAAMKGAGWVINQYDVLPDRVVVYLWPPSGGVKFNFKFRPRFGLNAKTAPSMVYDYYNPDSRAVVEPTTFRVR